MSAYEVEVKTLLGEQANADAFLARLKELDANVSEIGASSQLNHYFDQAGDKEKLIELIRPVMSGEECDTFAMILRGADKYALRSRQDSKVRLIIKAAKGDEDEQHALERLEGDYETTLGDIDALDELIQQAGYGFLSKWSRDRREFKYKDYTVTIDRNAGYGYLAEVEKVVATEEEAAAAKDQILAELDSLGFEELSQERIGRMFAFYNEHWPEYYRTDKTFTVE